MGDWNAQAGESDNENCKYVIGRRNSINNIILSSPTLRFVNLK